MHIIRLTSLLLLFLVLSACASSGGSTNSAKAEPSLRDQYVHAVNQGNRSRMSTVLWVNYPTDEQISRRLSVDTSSAESPDSTHSTADSD